MQNGLTGLHSQGVRRIPPAGFRGRIRFLSFLEEWEVKFCLGSASGRPP